MDETQKQILLEILEDAKTYVEKNGFGWNQDTLIQKLELAKSLIINEI